MEKMKQVKKDNAGYSLVELIVAIAIFSVVSIAFIEFLIVSLRQYQQGTMEVEIQYEAQLSVNQIQDMLIDAKKGVAYTVNSTNFVRSDAEIPAETSVGSKELTIYDTDRYYVLAWKAADKKIYYSEYTWDSASNSRVTVEENQLLAEYVDAFSMDLTTMDRNNRIVLDLSFKKDREYQVTQSVRLRNQISVNKMPAEVYE